MEYANERDYSVPKENSADNLGMVVKTARKSKGLTPLLHHIAAPVVQVIIRTLRRGAAYDTLPAVDVVRRLIPRAVKL